MSIWFAALQGLVQGLTEFLPVSSSGHLVLVQALFGSGVETNYMLFNVLLHFGTLLSVIVAFWKDIKELFDSNLYRLLMTPRSTVIPTAALL